VALVVTAFRAMRGVECGDDCAEGHDLRRFDSPREV
jgi:hypothetical protein